MDIADLADRYIEDQLMATLELQRSAGASFGSRENSGECDECGAPIPEGRLKAMPGCRCCLICTERQERMQAGFTHGRSNAGRYQPLDDYLLDAAEL